MRPIGLVDKLLPVGCPMVITAAAGLFGRYRLDLRRIAAFRAALPTAFRVGVRAVLHSTLHVAFRAAVCKALRTGNG
jgi:hypothetical protein